MVRPSLVMAAVGLTLVGCGGGGGGNDNPDAPPAAIDAPDVQPDAPTDAPPSNIPKLRNPVNTPEQAWKALESAGTTHVVVHTGAWDAAYVEQLEEWLTSRGARSHGRFDGAVVYELPGR